MKTSLKFSNYQCRSLLRRTPMVPKPVNRGISPGMQRESKDMWLTLCEIESTKQLLKKDIAKRLSKTMVKETKDISFIKESDKPQLLRSLVSLPTEMSQLKKLEDLDERPCDKGPYYFPCTKNECLDQVLSAALDSRCKTTDRKNRYQLGSPSGRQDIQNLWKWFSHMKHTHLKQTDSYTEDARTIVRIGLKEVIRQVSVNCTERGDLIRKLLNLQGKIAKEENKRYEDQIQKIKDETQKEVDYLRHILAHKAVDTQKQIEKFKKRNINLKNKLEQSKVEEENLKIQNKFNLKNRVVYAKHKKKTENKSDIKRKDIRSSEDYKHRNINTHRIRGSSSSFNQNFTQEHPQFTGRHEVSIAEEEEYKDTVGYKDTLEESNRSIGEDISESNSNNSERSSEESPQNNNELEAQNDNLVSIDEKETQTEMMNEFSVDYTSVCVNPFIEKEFVIEVSSCTEDDPLHSIQETIMESLPSEIDRRAWKAGFMAGYEYGRQEGIAEGEEAGCNSALISEIKKGTEDTSVLEELREEDEIEDDVKAVFQSLVVPKDTLNPRRASAVKRNSRKSFVKDKKGLTRFSVFNLKNTIAESARKSMIFQRFPDNQFSKPLKVLAKSGTMSRKIANKIMSGIYSAAFNKFKNERSLLDVTSEDFVQRFGNKTLAKKKHFDFICTLVRWSEFRRCAMFLKLINLPMKHPSYKPKVTHFYLKCLMGIINSKVGIVISFAESDDKQLCPVVRAVECVKDKAEILGKSKTSELISIIEMNSEPDPKKINRSGLIETEFVLEVLCNAYEQYLEVVERVLESIFEAFAISINDSIDTFIIGLIVSIYGKSTYSDLYQEIYYDDVHDLFIERYPSIVFDLDKSIQSCKSVDSEMIESEIKSARERYSLTDMFEGEDLETWTERLENCEALLTDRKYDLALFSWRILDQELQRISS